MNHDLRLLAMLVHQRKLDESVARAAMQSGDPRRWLIEHGKCSALQWQQWLATEGGTRPVLARYEVQELLGEGGSARVFAAVDRTDQRRLALKVLRQSEGGVRKEQIDAFVREARNAAKLNDPRLVQVYDVGADKGYHFLSMELVHGGSLARVLRANGAMPWAKAMPILRDIAAAQIGRAHV